MSLIKELTFEEFQWHLHKGNVVPVYRELIGDWLTPITILNRLGSGKSHLFLLERPDNGRYSYFGNNPYVMLRIRGSRIQVDKKDETTILSDDPLATIRKTLSRYQRADFPELPPFLVGFMGYFAYDIARWTQSLSDPHLSDHEFDDAILMFFDNLIVYDHWHHKLILIAHVFPDQQKDKSDDERYDEALDRLDTLENALYLSIQTLPTSDKAHFEIRPQPIYDRHAFSQMVQMAQTTLAAEELDFVTLANRWETLIDAAPIFLFRSLRYNYAGAPSFYFHAKERYAAGFAHRPLFQYYNGNDVTPTVTENVGFADYSRVLPMDQLSPGESYWLNQKIAALHADEDGLDLLLKRLPAASLCGRPLNRAMELVDQIEDHRRGVAGGTAVYLDVNGNVGAGFSPYTMLYRKGKLMLDTFTKIKTDTRVEDILNHQKHWMESLSHILDFARHELR